MIIPRNEYPRPQFEREDWINLNGEWEFEIDNAKLGEAKEYNKREHLDNKIIVPFCPESELSGINNKDFMLCVWYRKNIEIPTEWNDKNVILNFGAVDYYTVVYVNGEKVGEHRGGYTPFNFDITEYLNDNGNYITLCVYDDVRCHNQPAGKQSTKLNSYGCFYTRTTGIWQTVWLEAVDKCYIKKAKINTDIYTPSVHFDFDLAGEFVGTEIAAVVTFNNKPMGEAKVKALSNYASLNIELAEKHLWDLGEGNLYDVKFVIEKDGKVLDMVKSYFGLRSVCLDGRTFKLNGRTVFQRLVLDQGFYPDGIYTAPTEEALKDDIIYSLQLGFNGARLHEKVFEPRFLYWADKLGYMVWGEYPNWGLDITEFGQIQYILPEWLEALERDYNHPSIIGWCPFNETWDFEGKKQCDTILKMVYNATKSIDSTRPVIDTSGNYHVVTDIFDVHDYEYRVEEFKSYYSNIKNGEVKDQIYRKTPDRQKYDGKLPVFMSEYGGIRWSVNKSEGWGYGNDPTTEAEFVERYEGLTTALLENEYIMGFCYTQLYDVEQEENGLMTYGRKFKFNPELFKKINTQKAAIEK